MCGIFGIVGWPSDKRDVRFFKTATSRLFLLSESRGKEASGLAILASRKSEKIRVMKSTWSATRLINHRLYKGFLDRAAQELDRERDGFFMFGHTRLVTNGSSMDQNNNQPVIHGGAIVVHNGIIVNADELWRRHPDIERACEVDSEIIVALARKYYQQTRSLVAGVKMAFKDIRGTASVAITSSDLNSIVLATNNGSLYLARDQAGSLTYFASERFILEQFLKTGPPGFDRSKPDIARLHPNHGVIMDLNAHRTSFFYLDGAAGDPAESVLQLRTIETVAVGTTTPDPISRPALHPAVSKGIELEFQKIHERIVGALKRCNRCVLPETVPCIDFDDKGICNFCRHYKKIEMKERAALDSMLTSYRQPGLRPDCVVALSGGRDSCYGLHKIVNELGMKPITYTYDWGMVTDLARRNVSRMCSQLGIENITISADIAWKRANIRKNILAWLKRPHLGTVPLFMAGDKEFVYHAQRVKKQNGLKLDIFTFNPMEMAEFKEEYSGTRLWYPGDEQLRFWPRIQLGSFYAKEFLKNPRYLNKSIFDTLRGYIAYYFMPQTCLSLYQYLPWREEEVVGTIVDQYGWELATDTPSTWRIGDGTAAFYNYIYYVMGGFNENDTLRSNQVRENHLTRDQALALTHRDNQPRWESFIWYCDAVGLEANDVLMRIHEAPRRHPALTI